MIRKLAFSIVLTLIALGVPAPADAQTARQERDARRLAKWMAGSWDTFAQVDEDEEADTKYRHIRALLHVTPVAIAELGTGYALYVENQAAESRTKPYRQRVYFLTVENGSVMMRIYRISGPEEFVNAHKKPEVLKTLSFARLTRESGCDLRYERAGKVFKGKIVNAKACASGLRGATYTYSESEIGPDRWMNLDQGFDDAGNHKWGPPPGTIGHVFRRRK